MKELILSLEFTFMVLQPLAWVDGENAHRTFAACSLGNFISEQAEINREIGGILQLEVVKKTTINGIN